VSSEWLRERDRAKTILKEWFVQRTKVQVEVIAGNISVLLLGRIAGYQSTLVVQAESNEVNVSLLGARFSTLPGGGWTTEMVERFRDHYIRGIQIVTDVGGFCTIIETVV
jgi:hypothetical protein